MTKNITIAGLLQKLRWAESRLKIDGLFVSLQLDGSGGVMEMRGVVDHWVFRFDTLEQLAEWLAAPRVIDYDEEGEITEMAAYA